MRFREKVLELCKEIPKGRVTSYGMIARKLNSRAYRAVGQALKSNRNPIVIPCHRVVRSDGSLGGYAGRTNSIKKRILLAKEGIKIRNNRVVDFENRLFKW